ncbi:MAG TPA: M20/M25/M40 family metallo-hydrolase [Micropepsaceae bacterium]|jgi:carboxypeptidase PM20D1|nr:M20/M25/M40 family metallo-hydrolase [Micropepsaceae bacterium]
MKRIIIGIGVVLVTLLAFMMGRTVMIAPPVQETAAPPIPVDSDMVAKHLAEAVKFQTVSYGDGIKEVEKSKALNDMRLWMEQTYPYFHEAAGPEQFGDSLLFTWVGKNPNLPPVLLMAHLDVVPVVPGTEKDWMHQPFSGDIAGGYVWGRGTLDDKGQLITILEAANRLAMMDFQPERTIMFALGQDEEVGGQGNAKIAKALAVRGTHFAWVLDEGSSIMNEPYPGTRKPVAFISNAEKGFLTLELTAHGQGGHAARPSADLALPRLSSAILNVVGKPFVSALDDIQREKLAILAPLVPFGDRFILANLWLTKSLVLRRMEAEPDSAAVLHTTISPTVLSAGIKENVIPPTARALINFRLHPRDTIASVTAHVKQAVADSKVDVTEREETLSEATKIAGTNSAAYAYVANAIRATYGVPVAPDIMTGATDSRHYLPIADAVLRFRPYHEEIVDLARVHGTNERVAVSDLGPAVGFYMRLIQDLK